MLEVKLPLKLQPAGDLALQGIDIVRQCEKVAEENRVVIDPKRTVYMHECFMVYLNPDDFKRLDPLLDEIRKDAVEHLGVLKRMKSYLTRNAFEVDFQKNPRVSTGTCIVVSSTRKKLIRTVIDSVQLPPDSPLSLETASLQLDEPQAEALKTIFAQFDRGDREEAQKGIQRLNQEHPDWQIGQLLECMFWFIGGNSTAGLRYLNTHPRLAADEQGAYLKALAYLDVADVTRADEIHQRTFQRRPNALGYLVKGLINLAKDDRETAEKELKLAATMDDLFKHLPATYLRQHAHLSQVSSQHGVAEATTAPFLRLIQPFSRRSYTICVRRTLDVQLLKSSRIADQILKPVANAEKSHFRLGRDAQGLWMFVQEPLADELMLNGKTIDHRDGFKLRDEDLLQMGSVTLEYRFGLIKAGPKFHLGRRDPGQGCHFLTVSEGGAVKETWLFPVDEAVTLGRGRDRGNDLLLEDRGISAEHGEISWNACNFYFTDKDSSNGTAKNGKPFKGKVSLLHGDVIQLAGLSLEVRYGGVMSQPI
nr:FhaA domain-containing protein [Acanthopleuribacter pedis]